MNLQNQIDLRNAFAFALNIFADTGEDDESEESEKDEAESQGETEVTESGNDDDGEGEKEKQKKDKKLSDEAAKWRKQYRDAEKELKNLRDKDKSESDLLKEQAEQVPQLMQTNQDLMIENAFLKACDKYEVRDRELVQMLAAKSSHVKIEDGEVIGIDEAIEDVKKKKPLLFGKEETKKDESAGSGTNGASGRATNSKKTESGPDYEALRKKYPSTRR